MIRFRPGMTCVAGLLFCFGLLFASTIEADICRSRQADTVACSSEKTTKCEDYVINCNPNKPYTAFESVNYAGLFNCTPDNSSLGFDCVVDMNTATKPAVINQGISRKVWICAFDQDNQVCYPLVVWDTQYCNLYKTVPCN